MGAFAVVSFFLPARSDENTRAFAWLELVGYVIVLAAVLVAIFYSQSRGPQIGLLAGLAVFINVLLLRLLRSAVTVGSRNVRALRALMATAIAVELAVAAFLLAFNLSDAPFFERLRNVSYIGRFG